jgi:uncharacterized protein (DUF1778 family)
MPRQKQIVKRSSEIKFRVSALEKKVIQMTADQAGLNVSDFVRKSALNKTVRIRFTDEEIIAYKTLQDFYDYFRRLSNLIKNNNQDEVIQAIKETQALLKEQLLKFTS